MSSRKTKSKATKKRAQRATSNVFAMFDQAQIQEFKEAFNMIDQNRDGFIDKEDLADMLASLGTDELVLHWVIYSVKFHRRIMNILFILSNLKRSSFTCIVLFESLAVTPMSFCVMVTYIFKFLVKWTHIIDKNIKPVQ